MHLSDIRDQLTKTGYLPNNEIVIKLSAENRSQLQLPADECAFTFSSAYDICLFFDIFSYGHQYVGILHILLLFLG